MNNSAELSEACWKMYVEHCTQVRHHESQRSSVATSILTIATATIGLVTFDKSVAIADLPLTILLIFLGVFGALFSAKQYERASLHTERARSYRDAIDAPLDGALKRLKNEADARQRKNFPRLELLRLNKFWNALYLLLALIGCVLSTVAVFFPLHAC